MPLETVNIPYQSGSVGSITYDNLYKNDGNHYVWVGGDSGKKFISVRLQSSPNFVFVDTLEISSMTEADPTFTSLYSRAESMTAGAYKAYHINLCKVNSTTAYMKIFSGTVSANQSKHYILEIDESDDSISITEVTSQMSNYQKGGMYNNTGDKATTTGQGRCQKYMMYLQDNNIVTLEMIGGETSTSSGGYHFVHRIWDPSTSTLTSKTVVNGHPTSATRDYTDFNTDWHHISDPSGSGSTATSNESHPTLHGLDSTLQNSYFSQGGHFHMNQVTSRDGDQVHFLMNVHSTQAGNNMDDGFNNRTSIDRYYYQHYVITYIKSSNSWTCTSKRWTSFDPPGYYGVWLPINTLASSAVNTSSTNFKTGQQHADTWLFVDARYVRVAGTTSGGQISIVDTTQPSQDRPTGNSEAYEAHWLDETHFMVVWSQKEMQNYVGNVDDNMYFTVCKYTDENVIDVVSSGRLNDSSIQASRFSYTGSGPVLQKVDDFTYISNQFSNYVCVHAPA